MKGDALLTFVIAFLLTACDRNVRYATDERLVQGTLFTQEELDEIRSLSPIPSPPPNPTNRFADDPNAAVLGQALFFETRLSSNQEVSCATCHQPSLDWTDGKPVSEGLERVQRNSPTLINLAHNRWFFWDGRKDSLWAQSLGPIENAKEMGGSRVQAYQLVAGDDALRQAYERAFGEFPKLETPTPPGTGLPNPTNPNDPLQRAWMQLAVSDQSIVTHVFANLGKAMEAFERRLVSVDSPFDRFADSLNSTNPDSSILSDSAVKGLKLFVGKGQCTFCHSGPNFTDLEFHNIGLDRGETDLDTGRFAAVPQVKSDPFNGLGPHSDDRSINANQSLHYLAQKPNNLGEFKTPTLRNIANTGPYMHDGRFSTLEEVIRFYSELDQEPALGHREETLQPLGLTDTEIQDLKAFLESLTGASLDEALLAPPKNL